MSRVETMIEKVTIIFQIRTFILANGRLFFPSQIIFHKSFFEVILQLYTVHRI